MDYEHLSRVASEETYDDARFVAMSIFIVIGSAIGIGVLLGYWWGGYAA